MKKSPLALLTLFGLILTTTLNAGMVSGLLIFRDRFESGAPGWTTGGGPANNPNTDWELGTASKVGPAMAHSGSNVYATNIDSNYSLDADIWLRSPVIDLTGLPDAVLSYYQFRDIESMFDSGRVSIIPADSTTELLVLDPTVDGTLREADWEPITHALPASVLDREIRIEFSFKSDNFAAFAGWYLDDIEVRSSVPEPTTGALLVLGSLLVARRRRS